MAPTFCPSTARAAFRLALAEIAAKAKATLPECSGRIDSAVALVLAGDVELLSNGSALVGSQADPTLVYRVRSSQCECKDFVRAPAEFCKHRLAVGLYRRTQELVDSVPVEAEPDEEPLPLATSLPEAPASCNVYLMLGGHRVQVTLRDGNEQRMLARLQVLLDQYPVPQPTPQAPTQPQGQLSAAQHNAAAMHQRVTGFCAVHNVAMQLNEKEGRSWWSHKTAEGWCKGVRFVHPKLAV